MQKELEEILAHDRHLYEQLQQKTVMPVSPARLEITTRGEHDYYYFRAPQQGHRGSKIPMTEQTKPLAKEIAQRNYEEKAKRLLKQRIKQIEAFQNQFRDDALSVLHSPHEERSSRRWS